MITIEDLMEAAKVFIIWGKNFILMGLALMGIGLLILAIFNIYVEAKKTINPLNKIK